MNEQNHDGWRAKWQSFCRGMEAFYYAPYRRTLARATRDEEDLFMLMLFAESLGVPNPVAFYTLELQPIFLEAFHDWHTRMGIEHSPLDQFGCC